MRPFLFPKVLRLVLALLLMFAGSSAFAQYPPLQAISTADTAQITVGDPVHLKLEATVNAVGGILQWPSIPDSLGMLEVLERTPIDTIRKPDYITYRQQLTLTGFDSGEFYIPSFSFVLHNGSAALSTIATDSLPLLVQTMEVDTTKAIRPIKDIIEVPDSIWEHPVWLFAAGGLLLAIIAIAIWWIWLRKPKTAALEAPKPVEAPHVKALRLLSELEKNNLWQKGAVKEYYVTLTDVLRTYIEDRFHVSAPEQTTDEFLAIVRKHPELALYQEVLTTVLRTADAAKFARAQPQPQEHVDAFAATRKFVEKTPPPLVEEPSSPDNKNAG